MKNAASILLLCLALSSYAQAGVPEFGRLLESAAGRALLEEAGIAKAFVPGASAELARAEEALQRVRTDYLRRRPGDAAIFEPGAQALRPSQADALRAALRQEGEGLLRDLKFIESASSHQNYAGLSDTFVAGAAPIPAGPAVPTATAASVPGASGDAQKLRALVRDMLRASGVAEPAARAEAMRSVLVHHPEVAAWVADGRDFQKLMTEADIEIGAQASELTDVSKFIRGSVRAQLDAVLAATTLPVLAPFRDTVSHQGAQLAAALADPASPAGRQFLQPALRAYATAPLAQRQSLLKTLPDTALLTTAADLDRALQSARVSEVPAVRQIFDPNAGIDLGHLPRNKADLFEKILTRYFDQMALADKRRIVGALLDLSIGAPLEQKLGAVLQNCGPALQKLFQLIGRDAKSPLMRAVMSQLLSNIRPVEGAVVAQLVERELNQPLEAVFAEFSREPMAAASVGQVHLARLRAGGERVIVKVLKPGVRDNALREIETLKGCIGGTDFERDLVRNIEDALLKELDLRIEAQNLEAGDGYFSRYRGITVAGAVPGVRVTESLLVQRLAQGEVMSKLRSPLEIAHAATGPGLPKAARAQALAELTRRGDAIERLLGRWFERAIYGDGFFHADLHPGNLFYMEDPAGKAKPLLTMIDFGSADTLTVAQRRGFVQFSVAAAMKSPAQALEALSRFSEIPAASRQPFLDGLQAVFTSKATVVERVQKSLLLAVEHDMRIPREVFMFTRGDLFLEKQLQEINRALDVLDPALKAGRYDPIMTYIRVSSRHAALETPGKGLRLLPRRLRDYIFDFLGKDADPRVSGDIFNSQTLDDAWGASKDKLLEAIKLPH